MMKVSNVTVKSLFCKTAILNQWAAEAVVLPNGEIIIIIIVIYR